MQIKRICLFKGRSQGNSSIFSNKQPRIQQRYRPMRRHSRTYSMQRISRLASTTNKAASLSVPEYSQHQQQFAQRMHPLQAQLNKTINYAIQNIFNNVTQSISANGYAVILIHPQDFVKIGANSSLTSTLDENEINDLSRLLDLIISNNIRIGSLAEITAGAERNPGAEGEDNI